MALVGPVSFFFSSTVNSSLGLLVVIPANLAGRSECLPLTYWSFTRGPYKDGDQVFSNPGQTCYVCLDVTCVVMSTHVTSGYSHCERCTFNLWTGKLWSLSVFAFVGVDTCARAFFYKGLLTEADRMTVYLRGSRSARNPIIVVPQAQREKLDTSRWWDENSSATLKCFSSWGLLQVDLICSGTLHQHKWWEAFWDSSLSLKCRRSKLLWQHQRKFRFM